MLTGAVHHFLHCGRLQSDLVNNGKKNETPTWNQYVISRDAHSWRSIFILTSFYNQYIPSLLKNPLESIFFLNRCLRLPHIGNILGLHFSYNLWFCLIISTYFTKNCAWQHLDPSKMVLTFYDCCKYRFSWPVKFLSEHGQNASNIF